MATSVYVILSSEGFSFFISFSIYVALLQHNTHEMIALVFSFVFLCLANSASAGLSVYSESLEAGWTDRSWPGTTDLSLTANVELPSHGGIKFISVTVSRGQSLYLQTSVPFSGSAYSALK